MQDRDEDRLPGRQAVDWIAGALGGLAAISGDPLVAALGPLLQPALQTAFSLDERAWRRRALRGARTLQVAAEELGVGIDELDQVIGSSSERQELLARVLEASSRTMTLPEKVDVLGRVLAGGIRDDAKLDEAAILAAALLDMEAPHARVLYMIASYSTISSVTRDALLHEFKGLEIGIANIISVLLRHGLILDRLYAFSKREDEQGGDARDPYYFTAGAETDLRLRVTDERRPTVRGSFKWFPGPGQEDVYKRWVVSALGRRCLELLELPIQKSGNADPEPDGTKELAAFSDNFSMHRHALLHSSPHPHVRSSADSAIKAVT